MSAAKAYVNPPGLSWDSVGDPVTLNYVALIVDEDSNYLTSLNYGLIPGLSDTVVTMRLAMEVALIAFTGNLLLTVVFL